MTLGASLLLDLIAGITSLDRDERDGWADRAGFEFDDHGGIDNDERRVVWPCHIWCMCLEYSPEVRERFLSSIDSLAVLTPISPTTVAEILGWFAVTGTDPRAEVDYVETFTEIVTASGAAAEVALTPQRVAPFVDVLRGITSTSSDERARAARIVPDLLPGLRPEEQWGFTGVLTRAAIVEHDTAVRRAQLDVLASAHRAGAVHAHDGRLLVASFTEVELGDAERRALDEIDG